VETCQQKPLALLPIPAGFNGFFHKNTCKDKN